MATATKTARQFQTSGSHASSGTTTGSGVDLRTALGAMVSFHVTNPSGTITTGVDCVVDIANDGTDWHEYSRQTMPTTASADFFAQVELPASVMYARTRFLNYVHASATACTIEADGHELTSVG